MKLLKIAVMTYLLLNSINLYAESAKECMKYWNEPVVGIKVLGEVECEHIWDFGISENSQNRLKVLDQLKLKNRTGQWMSTGICQEILYNGNKYKIYNANYKEDKHDIWMIYNSNNVFSYFRKVANSVNGFGGLGVDLSCSGLGGDKNIKYILNSYLKDNTSINMRIYRENDWYKDK